MPSQYVLMSFPSSSRHFCLSLCFPSTTYFINQFLRKVWPIQLAFILLCLVGYFSPCWLFVTLLRLSHDPSNWSSPSGFTTTFQNIPGISDLLSELSNFHHHTSFYVTLKSNLPVKRFFLLKSPFVMAILDSIWRVGLALISYHAAQIVEIFHILWLVLIYHILYWRRLPWDSHHLRFIYIYFHSIASSTFIWSFNHVL